MTPDLAGIERRALAATRGEWTSAAHIDSYATVTLALVARIRRAEEALTLARSICADAFKDTGMDWDAETMAIIDAALTPMDPTP